MAHVPRHPLAVHGLPELRRGVGGDHAGAVDRFAFATLNDPLVTWSTTTWAGTSTIWAYLIRRDLAGTS